MNIEDALEVVRGNPNYRVLERFVPQHHYYQKQGQRDIGDIKRGLYVDTETTGVDTARDDILELGIVPFLYTPYEIIEVQANISYLNDPGRPLDENIRSLTGITDEELKGESIDVEFVDALVLGSSLIIAHNAGFDRRILERLIPSFALRPWGCSQQDVPWRKTFGALAERLEVIAMQLGGVFYEAHRALADCQIGVHLLATIEDREGNTAFSHLFDNVAQDSIRIWATGAPFSTKDMLKARGYNWNGGDDGRPKAWHRRVTEEQLAEETQWLREYCYAHPQVSSTNAIDRYSVRDR